MSPSHSTTDHTDSTDKGALSREAYPCPSVKSVVKKSDLIAFEDRIRSHWESGNLPCLLHLCGGNEEQLIEIFRDIRPGDWVFSSHRNHYHALLKGIPADQLEQSILRGDSMFTFSREHNFYSSAILAGTCCIAAGVAWSIKQETKVRRQETDPLSPVPCPLSPVTRAPRVWCFLGDGAEEEGHFYEAALFVEANDLPCTFIIEDNQRQVDTDKVARRGVLLGCPSWRPLDHFRCVRRYHYTPTYPHAGSGAKAGSIVFKPKAVARLRQTLNA